MPTEQDGIKNLDNFTGDAIHSSKIWSIQDYVKEKQNKTVLIIGAWISGYDLLEIIIW